MASCAPNCVKKGAPRECNEFEYKWGSGNHTETNVGPEGSCMYSSVGEGRPSDAGGPRFDPQCPLFHQIHVIYEVYCDM